ncbi:restriction endonuclease subunit S [Acinetobacter sp. ANC 4862]|uniref:restriction endonuclease subunit S n=1 Tax=Acinetobacter sp. ANC 4862 TaxID=2529849 RepID=UPI00103AD51B|nr:restriction endonuclease subunit S [Acinetobacter sp. ANC 4862]TCH65632.1 restriction endonuclease subunit S [Acinetobacter sp. ANC 4862]
MAKYQKYAEYKDSGNEWLGEIPKSWSISRLKYIADIFGRIGFRGYTVDDIVDEGEGALVLSPSNILGDQFSLDKKTYLSWKKYCESPEIMVELNDILLVKTGSTYGKSTIILEKKEPMTINPQMALLKKIKLEPRFLYYLFQSTLYKAVIDISNTGSGMPTMTQENINSFPIPFPAFNDALNIADFLDHETAKIDSLIAKQKKLIELLKEKRQSVISHAVTKGLNPDVAMKDSGVEWLGQVPEHWNVLPIKYLTKYVGTGGTPKNQSSFAEVPEINWFTPGDFSGDLKIVDSSKYVTFSSVEDGDSKLYEGKSVLMIGIGATLGKVAISDRDFSCNQQINVLTCNKLINPEFLTFSLMSQLEQIKQLSNSSTIGIINQEKTKQISISVPSVEEQNKIIHFIMGNIEKFNTLINKAESAIQLMQERRTALISSAVTGKINVSNWQHPNEAKTEFSA